MRAKFSIDEANKSAHTAYQGKLMAMITRVITFTPLTPNTALSQIQMSIPYRTERITGSW